MEARPEERQRTLMGVANPQITLLSSRTIFVFPEEPPLQTIFYSMPPHSLISLYPLDLFMNFKNTASLPYTSPTLS